MVDTVYKYYNAKQVYLDADGRLREQTVKRSTVQGDVYAFVELAKSLSPESKFYITENYED